MARFVNASNEIDVLQYLRDAPQSRNHLGHEHILGILDHFRASGPNGTHNVLVLVGPSLDELRSGNDVGEEFVWKQSSLRITSKEVALGIAYLHELGVAHSGMVLLSHKLLL